MIVCNKDQNTYRISHFRWWHSLLGWTGNKEDTTDDIVHNSRDQNKDIGELHCAFWLKINTEFSRFFYFVSVFLVEKNVLTIYYTYMKLIMYMFVEKAIKNT